MNLFEGMIIWTFPDTDIKAYKRVIEESGFRAIVGHNYIQVGKSYSKEKMDSNEFGKFLIKKRRAKDITRQDLSLKIGVSQATIFDWEIGRRLPRDYNLKKLKELLDISEGELKCLIKKQ